jgi:3-amino-4-hydroxybenzoic acid synthase
MKLCWLDIRSASVDTAALVADAIHHRIDGIVAAHTADLEPLPPTITRVLFPQGTQLPEDFGRADLVIVDPSRHGEPPAGRLADAGSGVEFGCFVEVMDAQTLERACHSACTEAWTVLHFREPTKIPLEIVLAAAAGAQGRIVVAVADPEEAGVVFGVLEHGCDGVMMAPAALGDAARLKAAADVHPEDVHLVELEVSRVTRVGMGERACVDTCTYLRPNEGLLVGSTSRGMMLCASETHPLPYMPTRPFRVNAGAIMSYTLGADERTQYLTDLRSGSKVLAVDALGHTRLVTVGRTKIESRPLLSIDAVAPDGQTVNLIVQDDWHVRLLGPGGAVLNSTELKPADRVLGHLLTKDRHVGYPIDELCYEQ